MNKEFVNHKTALALKELGFDEDTIVSYNFSKNLKNNISSYVGSSCKIHIDKRDSYLKAPLYQQVFRWFREKYGLVLTLEVSTYNGDFTFNIWQFLEGEEPYLKYESSTTYTTYEEAQKQAILELIKIVSNE